MRKWVYSSLIPPWGRFQVELNQARIRRLLATGHCPLLVPTPPPGRGGRLEGYYHFLFDLVLPLTRLFDNFSQDQHIALRPFGVFTNRIVELFGDRVQILPEEDVSHPRQSLPLVGMNPVGVWLTHRNLQDFRQEILGRTEVVGEPPPSLVVLIERSLPETAIQQQFRDANRGGSRRSIANHHELRDRLAVTWNRSCEFRNVRLESLSFRDQVETFARAAVVIGQHGAGLANIAWMSPGGVVIELTNRPNRFTYQLLARRCGHSCHCFKVVGDHATVHADRLLAWMRDQTPLQRFLN